MKRICAITMARNDEFNLRRWMAYYGRELGMENLYVFLDGKDQKIPEWYPEAHVTACEKIPGKVTELDRLLVSLELEEVMSLSDRILVMYEGEIVGELDPKKTTVQELGLYMAGAKRQGKEASA